MKQSGINKQIKLVISPPVYELLKGRAEMFQSLEKLKADVVLMEFERNFYYVQNKLKEALETTLTDAKSVMILQNVPLKYKKKKGQKLIYINPGTTLFSNANIKGIAGLFMFAQKADEIDVLDPGVYRLYRRFFFYKRNSFHNTQFGISQSHMKFPEGIDYNIKDNSIVFLGNLIPFKQILELLDCAYEVHTRLKEAGIPEFKFEIIGNGVLNPEADKRIAALQEKGVQIRRIKTYAPYEFLYKAKVILSLQLFTNYPSQSLVEGMLCGCLPVVTDCGDSKKLADPALSYYVNEKFSAEELANHFISIFKMDQPQFEERSQAIIKGVLTKFSPEVMARYYNSLL